MVRESFGDAKRMERSDVLDEFFWTISVSVRVVCADPRT